jgi:hypothetical protein
LRHGLRIRHVGQLFGSKRPAELHPFREFHAGTRHAVATSGMSASLSAARWPNVSYDAQLSRQRFSGTDVIPPPYAGTTVWRGAEGLNFGTGLLGPVVIAIAPVTQ